MFLPFRAAQASMTVDQNCDNIHGSKVGQNVIARPDMGERYRACSQVV
jgi:hypothetical protein